MTNVDLTPMEHHWQTWLNWAATHDMQVPEDSAFLTARALVWTASEFVAVNVARDPARFAELIVSGDLLRPSANFNFAAQLDTLLNHVTDETQLASVLRQFRCIQMIRIIWRELANWASLSDTFIGLTTLADVCVQHALARLYAWHIAEYGVPNDTNGQPQSLVVLAMGKLGAGELNLSSDIDLIFAFPSHGEVSSGPRPLSSEQFFIRLSQRLIHVLDTQTADGFVFRVDTRLRPFGDSGPLVMSFDALEAYYQAQAREWERYAMIKARVIAGTPAATNELMAILNPFVYRRYLDFAAIASLRHLKKLIDRELQRKGLADNIKLGPGGIREIEFIGQAFQLIRGGREPELQVRPILTVLRLLGEKAILPMAAVNGLVAAYTFLRRLENRLQAWQDRQTHTLPIADNDRLRLAHSLGYDNWNACYNELQCHRELVQAQFDASIAEQLTTDQDCVVIDSSELWPIDSTPERAVVVLHQLGFNSDEALLIHTRLLQFEQLMARKGLSQRGRERLERLMPKLLHHLMQHNKNSVSQVLILERLLRVLEAITGRTAYLALLVERPEALKQLVRLCAMSPWFSERTARQPLLLDELLDPRRLFAPLRSAELERELTTLLATVAVDDLEQQMERLRQFAHGQCLRVAAADVTGVIPLMVVSDYLTDIAQVTVRHALRLAWNGLCDRYELPILNHGEFTPGFIIIGYGKFGGIELGYHSDLDLVFLYDETCCNAPPAFYLRLSQRFIHILTTPTYSGYLYEVDTRLRPDGNKGLIARTLDSFADYQLHEAWTWEHQALVRARAVVGDAQLITRFQAVRHTVLTQSRTANKLRTEVAAMRMKMRSALDRSTAEQFDLKQGAGGIADIEFMVQYAVLRWAATHSELTEWTDNIRLLATLEQLALLPSLAAAELTEAYKTLRTAYHSQALQDAPGVVKNDCLTAVRATVIAWWQHIMDDATD
ncbi:bifunctional [glutamate--ammonia ligase]-adenylyl-L-tyrosine phosphorylase/[glutamate--ammonia-ligase] adenylyltransferase [Thiospirillum jenense]|uniref:Bifunctional glutamine synthetase adenylyltransferase/adenylyl-removing enzyme n=1 Tax=Thiospirillum jenense TaxID=1653858 RepID=A0A839HFL7_9GAMM|nr:bifunctional [glutamate--ammonia ligase]-adenylyl-L-tyrosine phosphorylase/[glutamate--ammonia-ligase] adenylyltransferase [Thiospirillum jenense]MBB1125182.1 bifunctional [glutamate--ammonia ligase]-adenylyl-L-tyrosine phosphorylase/[glutamate--ammonia-ligase] adenylyltransferase [Thiospirillum jenense]